MAAKLNLDIPSLHPKNVSVVCYSFEAFIQRSSQNNF